VHVAGRQWQEGDSLRKKRPGPASAGWWLFFMCGKLTGLKKTHNLVWLFLTDY
jgi:hypothetical protein